MILNLLENMAVIIKYINIECPYCHSMNTKKISNIAKAGSVAMFGIFSQKVKHQWHCNSCGSDF